ncbi:tRNAHis guanylyltransferase [Sistotremastrum niveocremeum HHB9708]|uniref:tRNA(His) guanylyltransferase n=1 Tax=Sistotremastrum niveocremeum HHB9708 TaxID=1314777 RepID=A0A164VK96_9AGAM|nr:tRNAHis guanylyltransferase [Sistotremastrum niveocremeum HHB9708]
MAGSKYAYVKNFEIPDPLLPNTYMVLRVDGHGFHRFSESHSFTKPNDQRALELMDAAALAVMQEYRDIVLAFGESDEYSFLFRRSTQLYNRRQSKILSTIVSYFTSCYVMNWSKYFPSTPLEYPPSFDGRIVLYPTEKEVRDYFSWRQADTHINNLYNTLFWALVQEGEMTTADAHATLKGTVSGQKNEMLHSRFGINYNTLSARFRKGSVISRKTETPESVPPDESDGSKRKAKPKVTLEISHVDIIGDEFWNEISDIL